MPSTVKKRPVRWTRSPRPSRLDQPSSWAKGTRTTLNALFPEHVAQPPCHRLHRRPTRGGQLQPVRQVDAVLCGATRRHHVEAHGVTLFSALVKSIATFGHEQASLRTPVRRKGVTAFR